MTDTPVQYGAIFDIDGTLMDSMVAWREASDILAQMVGLEHLPEETASVMNTMTVDEIIDYAVTKFPIGWSVEQAKQELAKFMYNFYATKAVLKPGAREYLEALHAQGVKMAIATSTPLQIQMPALQRNGLVDLMDGIFSATDIGVSKRETTVFDMVLESLGTTPENTWVFEDSIYAIRTANAMGMHTVGVYEDDISATASELEAEAGLFIHSFEELVLDPALPASK